MPHQKKATTIPWQTIATYVAKQIVRYDYLSRSGLANKHPQPVDLYRIEVVNGNVKWVWSQQTTFFITYEIVKKYFRDHNLDYSMVGGNLVRIIYHIGDIAMQSRYVAHYVKVKQPLIQELV